jgi:hypothetical protein
MDTNYIHDKIVNILSFDKFKLRSFKEFSRGFRTIFLLQGPGKIDFQKSLAFRKRIKPW